MAAVSLLYGAARLEGGAEGPVVGHLIDRFGSRVVIIVGASLAGIGLILLLQVIEPKTMRKRGQEK